MIEYFIWIKVCEMLSQWCGSDYDGKNGGKKKCGKRYMWKHGQMHL